MLSRRKRATAIAVAVLLGTSGCATHQKLSAIGLTKLGYIPYDINREPPTPTKPLGYDYAAVRAWAEAVAEGYDTRRWWNRYAIYSGAFVAAAAAGAMAGLAAFDSGNSALIGIPIGTAFLGTTSAYFQNDVKAKVYSVGARDVIALMNLEDWRIANTTGATPTDDKLRQIAACLLENVHEVVAKVEKHVENTDPSTVVDDLKKIKAEKKEADKKVDEAKQTGNAGDVAKAEKERDAVVTKALADATSDLSDLETIETVCCIPKDAAGKAQYAGPVTEKTGCLDIH